MTGHYEVAEATDRQGKKGPFLVYVAPDGKRTWIAQFYCEGDSAEPGDLLPSHLEARGHALRVLCALNAWGGAP